MSSKYKNLKLQGSLMIIAEGAKYWEPEETIDELKQLLKDHITENESGALVSLHIMSKDFKEFLDE